jgi:hypothetical protein
MQAQLSGGNLPGKTDFLSGVQDWGSSILDAPEATDYSKGLLNEPDLGGYKKAGRGESILSGLGTGLSLAGSVGGGALGAVGGGTDGGSQRQFNNYPTDAAAPTAYGFKLPRVALEEAFTNYPEQP